ncbi:nuclear transport factor 2 family protein [Nocardia donostiensis]|uniref:SnoaL-like domain-containing protein n=1 Tax=Nocardia donostiensis TaxID=1538463 RepID=A0A1V2TG94_9NOCA|nr:nuclear transport factor 2 family protein [Nocardia donostiensis]ONM48530.1 hypothetical protein B0T46_11985 [Nocardia donostiensis]OQS16401.1 hypothetical protein B0T36_05225 [Nocardia donostiensis]OQS17854.1 hypothetical protein B0T44_22750 [Nocardia donostiensis]
MIAHADHTELADLVHRYACYADRRELELLAQLFTVDATLVMPDLPRSMPPTVEARGRDEIIEVCGKLRRTHATLHAVVGLVIDAGATPDEATGDVACIAHHLSGKPGSVVDTVWHLRYRDRYRRVEERWLIARRVLHLEWIEQRPVSAMAEPTDTPD